MACSGVESRPLTSNGVLRRATRPVNPQVPGSSPGRGAIWDLRPRRFALRAARLAHAEKDICESGSYAARTPQIARPVVPSCWRAWLHLASLAEERGDLPGYLLEFVDLAVGGDEARE